MRTTINIDDDILATVRSLARSRSVSVGTIVSELIRKSLQPSLRVGKRNNLPVFSVPLNAHPITLEDVKKIEDEW